MEETQRIYLPAAGHEWLLPLYDPLVKLLGGGSAHRQLVDQTGIQPGHRVLEIGCGTGNLVILVKRLYPRAEVVGLDPDPKALARARRKAERDALSIQFDRGFSDALPYPAGSFDRVLSAFMFHTCLIPRKRPRLCLRRGACSCSADLFTCLISEERPGGLRVISNASFIGPSACVTTPGIGLLRS